MLRFIDYLPLPVYILISVLSITGIIKYIILNKEISNQEKTGAFIMIIGVISLIIFNIGQKNLFIEYLPFLGLVGFLIFSGGIVRRVKDPEQKRQLRKYFIFVCISFSLIGILAIYTIIVKGY